MQGKEFSRRTITTCVIALSAMFAVTGLAPEKASATVQEKVLHSFNNNAMDGYEPLTNVIVDASGNVYGTTNQGGLYGAGVVFELTPSPGGGWRERILHQFNPANGRDGATPSGGLIFDASGNLYGFTGGGGAYGGGILFELTPHAGGPWSEEILYSFSTSTGGFSPGGSVVFDAAGNIYGTTSTGGAHTFGTVFKLTKRPGGSWAETVLHSFPDSSTDGVYPGALIFDSAGNLYGTSFNGGANYCPNQGANCGTVWELTPAAGGVWTETIIHNFADDGVDGILPIGGLVFDASGNLYSTTFIGGSGSLGIVYELTPAGGIWTETVLHSFVNDGDGIIPGGGGLIADATGDFYGTTQEGGTGSGTIYKFTPVSGGGWTYSIFFEFGGTNGQYPVGGLAIDGHGNLYGTTQDGGANNDGTAYAVKP